MEESPLTVPVIQQLLTGLAHLSHHNNDAEIHTTACQALANLEMNIVENKKAAAIESDIAALNALSSKTLAILERYLFPTEVNFFLLFFIFWFCFDDCHNCSYSKCLC